MKLTNNLKTICKQKKISLLSIATHFGVTYAQVNLFANGKQERIKSINPTDLAEFLGVEVSEIFMIE